MYVQMIKDAKKDEENHLVYRRRNGWWNWEYMKILWYVNEMRERFPVCDRTGLDLGKFHYVGKYTYMRTNAAWGEIQGVWNGKIME